MSWPERPLPLSHQTLDPGVLSSSQLSVPIRRVASDRRAHWFGYYDIAAFDRTGTKVLCCASDFEWRAPTAADKLDVGVIDLAQGGHFAALGTSRAWSWQQASLLQWRPNRDSEVLWNDRIGDSSVTRIHNLESGEQRVLDTAFYALSGDGKSALACNLDRLEWMRPGYGCAPIDRPTHRAPDDDGVFLVDLEHGRKTLIVSLERIASHEADAYPGAHCWHYVNHLSFCPDGVHFAAIHRWRRSLRVPRAYRAVLGFGSRLLVGTLDGQRLWVVDDSGHTSHFAWRTPTHIVAWTRPRGRCSGLYSIDVHSGITVQLPGFDENGHHSYLTLPGETSATWMVNDTYPKPSRLRQQLYVVHLASGRRYDLGEFSIASPLKIGETRCDLHPRISPDGARICFDSAHEGRRQLYIAELGELISSEKKQTLSLNKRATDNL